MYNKYDTFWLRLGAVCIDVFVVVISRVFFDMLLKQTNMLIILMGVFIVSSFTYVLYSVFFHWKYGQTIGKMVMGVKVVDLSEIRGLSLKQAFIRDIVMIIFSVINITIILIEYFEIANLSIYELHWVHECTEHIFMAWFLTEILTMLLNKKRRAIHDYLANTVVIKYSKTNNSQQFSNTSNG